jgi:hypothetical protein
LKAIKIKLQNVQSFNKQCFDKQMWNEMKQIKPILKALKDQEKEVQSNHLLFIIILLGCVTKTQIPSNYEEISREVEDIEVCLASINSLIEENEKSIMILQEKLDSTSNLFNQDSEDFDPEVMEQLEVCIFEILIN